MDSVIAEDFVSATMQGELKSIERQKSLLTSRASTVTDLLDEKRKEVEKYKKALAQERSLKHSVIGKLVRLKYYPTESFDCDNDDCLNMDGNREYENRKLKLELELVEEELRWVEKHLNALLDQEKRFQEKDRRLTALKEEVRQLEIKVDDQKMTIFRLKSNLKKRNSINSQFEKDANTADKKIVQKSSFSSWRQLIRKRKD